MLHNRIQGISYRETGVRVHAVLSVFMSYSCGMPLHSLVPLQHYGVAVVLRILIVVSALSQFCDQEGKEDESARVRGCLLYTSDAADE